MVGVVVVQFKGVGRLILETKVSVTGGQEDCDVVVLKQTAQAVALQHACHLATDRKEY